MYPESQPLPQPQQPTPPDSSVPSNYLDQIAPQTPKRIGIFGQKPAIIGIIALLLIAFAVILLSIPPSTNSISRLAARLNATSSVANGASSMLRSTKLRSINSNLKIYLTNTIRDMAPFLTKQKINIKKLDKSITAAESTSDMLAILEDARLNAVYDRTYAREMAYKLSTVITLMKEVRKKTNSASFRTFLDTSMTNLAPTQQGFADFNTENN